MAIVTPKRSYLDNAGLTNYSEPFSSTNPISAYSADQPPFEGYNPFALVRNDLRVNPFGNHVEVSGKIFDETGIKPLSNASVEIWHLSPDLEQFKHRARLYSDRNGNYRFITDLPARELGKNFQIYFKITVGHKHYYTKLTFNHCLFWMRTRNKNTRRIKNTNMMDYEGVPNTPETPFLLNIKLQN